MERPGRWVNFRFLIQKIGDEHFGWDEAYLDQGACGELYRDPLKL